MGHPPTVKGELFLPTDIDPGVYSASDYATWLETRSERQPHPILPYRVALNWKVAGNATLAEFRSALQDARNDVVAFSGHAHEATIVSPGGKAAIATAVGLCFGRGCTYPKKYEGSFKPTRPGFTFTPVDTLSPRARVVFISACKIGREFESWWSVPAGHALILPGEFEYPAGTKDKDK